MDGTTTGSSDAEESTQALTLSLGAPRPNPAQSGIRFAFTLPAEGPITLRVFDNSGRSVRTLAQGVMGAGSYTGRWDGSDDAGHAVAPGIYFYELRTEGERLSRQVTWMR